MYKLLRHFDNTPSQSAENVTENVAGLVQKELNELKADIWRDQHITDKEREALFANVLKKSEDKNLQDSMVALKKQLHDIQDPIERDQVIADMAGGTENVKLWKQALGYEVDGIESSDRVKRNALAEALKFTLQDADYQKQLSEILEKTAGLSADDKKALAALLATNDTIGRDPEAAAKYLQNQREAIKNHKPLVERVFDEYGSALIQAGFAENPDRFDAQAAIDATMTPIMKAEFQKPDPKVVDPKALAAENAEVSEALAIAGQQEGGLFGTMNSLGDTFNFMKPRESSPMGPYDRMVEALGARNKADLTKRIKEFIEATDGKPPAAFEKYHVEVDINNLTIDEEGRIGFEDSATEAERQFALEAKNSIPAGWKGTDEAKEYLALVANGVDDDGDGNYEPERRPFMTWLEQEDKASGVTKIYRSILGFFKGMKLSKIPFIGDFFKEGDEEAEAEEMSESMREWVGTPPSQRAAQEKEAADARRLEEMEDKTQELADKGQIRLAPGEIGNVGGLENDLAASWETLLEFAGQNNRVWGTALKQGFELDKLIGVYDQVEKGGLTLIEQPIQTKGGGIETPFVIDYGDDAEPPTKKIEWSVLKEGARELRMDTLNRGMEVNYAAWAPFLQELDDNDKYSPYVEEIDEKLGINWDQVTRENILGNCIYLVMKLESLQYVHNLIKSGELIGEPKVKGPGGKDIESFTLKFDKDGNLTDKAPEGGEQVRVKTYDWSEIEKHHTEDMAAFVSGEVESAQKLAVERQADIKAIEENRSFIESNLMTGIKFDEVNYNSFWSDNFKGERNEDGTWTITEGLFSGNKFPNLEEAYLMMALAVKAKIDIEKDGNWIIRNREAYFEPTVWGYGIDWEPSSWSPFDVGIIDSNVASQMQGRLGNIQFTDLIAKLNNIYSVFNSSYPKTEAA